MSAAREAAPRRDPSRGGAVATRLAASALLLLALLLLAGAYVSRDDPRRAGRWLLDRLGAPAAWIERPREALAGGNEPPAPRVDPGTEALDANGLGTAGDYAQRTGADALFVARHGHIVFERYWHGTSWASPRDAQAFTRLLTDLAVLAAVSSRQIATLDLPLGRLLPRWRDDRRGGITLRQLVHGRGGLALAGSGSGPAGRPARERFGSDARAAALTRSAELPAGARWDGEGASAQLLASALEGATGQRYAQWVSRRLWRPLGAADAALFLDRPGGATHAECCLVAAQGDWLRVAQLLLEDGHYRGDELLRPGNIAQLRERAGTDGGWFIPLDMVPPPATAPPPAADLTEVAAAGGNRMWIIPSLQLAIVRLGPPPRNAEWDEARIPGMIVAAVRDVQPGRGPDLDLRSLVPQH